MKKVLYFIFLLNLIFFNNLTQASIGFIDVNYILQNSNDGKKIINEIKILKKKNDDLINLKKNDIENQQNNLIKIKNITQEEEFQKKVSELQVKINEFNLFEQNKAMLYEKLKKEKLDTFFVSLNKVLRNYIQNNNIQIVIDNKNIVIADETLNISNEILNLINKN